MPDRQKSKINLFIINVVKEKRIEKKWSQSVVASKLNLSNAFIGSVENPLHRAKYNIDHINKLAEIFECSPKDFLPENKL